MRGPQSVSQSMSKGSLVAVISDATAFLGLDNQRSPAAIQSRVTRIQVDIETYVGCLRKNYG